jgi:hypothetical protein
VRYGSGWYRQLAGERIRLCCARETEDTLTVSTSTVEQKGPIYPRRYAPLTLNLKAKEKIFGLRDLQQVLKAEDGMFHMIPQLERSSRLRADPISLTIPTASCPTGPSGGGGKKPR